MIWTSVKNQLCSELNAFCFHWVRYAHSQAVSGQLSTLNVWAANSIYISCKQQLRLLGGNCNVGRKMIIIIIGPENEHRSNKKKISLPLCRWLKTCCKTHCKQISILKIITETIVWLVPPASLILSAPVSVSSRLQSWQRGRQRATDSAEAPRVQLITGMEGRKTSHWK